MKRLLDGVRSVRITATEWQELLELLPKAAAGQVLWGDQPLELLPQGARAAWRRAAGRPGEWIGGLARPPHVGPRSDGLRCERTQGRHGLWAARRSLLRWIRAAFGPRWLENI